MAVTTWANGFGIWRVRVPRDAAAPIPLARTALRNELRGRESALHPTAPEFWMNPVRVPEHDDEVSIVYREGDRPAIE